MISDLRASARTWASFGDLGSGRPLRHFCKRAQPLSVTGRPSFSPWLPGDIHRSLPGLKIDLRGRGVIHFEEGAPPGLPFCAN
jgi:hypothetical protein